MASPCRGTSDRAARATVLLTLSCVLLAGCGAGSGMSRVKGRVTLNGQPVEGAMVQFQPTTEGAPSSGLTDAEGRYSLMYTFDTTGAMPGEYIVSIRTAGTDSDDCADGRLREERIPARYNVRTELRRTVEPGRNTIDFDL